MSTGPASQPDAARRPAPPFAEIAVDVPARAARPGGAPPAQATFHYRVPAALAGLVGPGQLVRVPFGRRRLVGIVVALSAHSPVERLRDIEALVDERPFITPADLELARWMSANTMAPLFSCLRTMLPPGTVTRFETWYHRTRRSPRPESLSPAQLAVLARFGARRELRLAEIGTGGGIEDLGAALAGLVEAGLLEPLTRPAGRRASTRHQLIVHLTGGARQAMDDCLCGLRSHAGADIVAFMRRPGTVLPAVNDVLAATGANRAALRRLAQRGIVEITADAWLAEATVSAAQARHLADGELARAPSQARLLVRLADAEGPQSAGPMLAETATDRRVLGALEARGLVRTASEPERLLLGVHGLHARETELALRGVAAHAAALDLVTTLGGSAPMRDITAATAATSRTLRELEAAGLVRIEERPLWRDPLAGREFPARKGPMLTSDQERAWRVIEPMLAPTDGSKDDPGAPAARPPVLVHGVTGSGKTEIYLRAIEHVLAGHGQAIVLVPEIALTPQIVERFAARFPSRVGVWHSRLSDGERLDTWLRARDGQIDIVVGSRSAVFAPLPRLRVIVLDEEHADSYKQAQTPRYHARDVAIRRAANLGSLVILGSATPAVETVWQAERGAYARVELPRRVATPDPHGAAEHAGTPSAAPSWGILPPVTVVDMRAELRAGNTSIFSRALEHTLGGVLDAGEQAILFLNRRGSATFVLCRDCGHVESCPRCHLPLTYHGAGQALVCHHCNHQAVPPIMCPACGSTRIRYFGTGTQRVERTTRERFPEARVLRWDADTTLHKGDHDALLAQFASGRADVLVGTQMIAKGLDLPRVTLVGVVSADTALHLPDFRAAERTFQVLSQVAGRAGRSERGGQVILQSYQPEHPAIRAAADHDYEAFYAREIQERARLHYPPWRRLVRLDYITDRGAKAAERETGRMADRLRVRIAELGLPETDLVGPAPAFFGRVRGRHRWLLVVRSPDPHALLGDVPMGSGWRLDVDPVSLL